MFLRWKTADLVMDLMWDWNERGEWRMTPQQAADFWGREDGAAVHVKTETPHIPAYNFKTTLK